MKLWIGRGSGRDSEIRQFSNTQVPCKPMGGGQPHPSQRGKTWKKYRCLKKKTTQQCWEWLVFINFHSFYGQSHPQHPAERNTHPYRRSPPHLEGARQGFALSLFMPQNAETCRILGLIFFPLSPDVFFLGILILLMQSASGITGARLDADKQLATSQWLVTSGAFWDAKSTGGLLQNLEALTVAITFVFNLNLWDFFPPLPPVRGYIFFSV